MKILIVDDSAAIRTVIRGLVERMGHSVLEADDGRTGLDMYIEERPELVLIDVVMPNMDGYEAATRMRALGPDEWVPIIFLSSRESDQDLDRAIESGGDDYLVKPVSFAVLNAKIRALQRIEIMRRKLVEVSRDLALANRQLERLSAQDGLTGIANRRHFDSYLQSELRRVARVQEPLGLILLDVDHFKAFNDHYGHQAGDQCLQQIAAAMTSAGRRPADLPARYGGEEFAMVLPGTSLEGAVDVARLIARELDDLHIVHAGSAEYSTVTVSQGITALIPTQDTAAESLIKAADQALYQAKQQGRNRFVAVTGYDHP